MMNKDKVINVGQKWLCIRDSFLYEDGGGNDIVHEYKKGDIIEITFIDLTLPYPYYTNTFFTNEGDKLPLKMEEFDNFILLAEYRNERIDQILSDD